MKGKYSCKPLSAPGRTIIWPDMNLRMKCRAKANEIARRLVGYFRLFTRNRRGHTCIKWLGNSYYTYPRGPPGVCTGGSRYNSFLPGCAHPDPPPLGAIPLGLKKVHSQKLMGAWSRQWYGASSDLAFFVWPRTRYSKQCFIKVSEFDDFDFET